MNALGEAVGELCKIVLPIREEFFLGNPGSQIAICTLSSIDLLRKLRDSPVLSKVSVVGRLLSENKGIDSLLDRVYRSRITTILVCGRDVQGHRAGHSLFQLHSHGLDSRRRIVNSASPDPYITATISSVAHFRSNVRLIDMIDETDPERICQRVRIL